jgi:hypothetical protein
VHRSVPRTCTSTWTWQRVTTTTTASVYASECVRVRIVIVFRVRVHILHSIITPHVAIVYQHRQDMRWVRKMYTWSFCTRVHKNQVPLADRYLSKSNKRTDLKSGTMVLTNISDVQWEGAFRKSHFYRTKPFWTG